jgi:glycine/D-amino acid oxidase-like deaminating enzyme
VCSAGSRPTRWASRRVTDNYRTGGLAGSWVIARRRQLIEMGAHTRCSIVFHRLAAGPKRQIVRWPDPDGDSREFDDSASFLRLTDSPDRAEDYRSWIEMARSFGLNSRVARAEEVEQIMPGFAGRYLMAIFTPSDRQVNSAS